MAHALFHEHLSWFYTEEVFPLKEYVFSRLRHDGIRLPSTAVDDIFRSMPNVRVTSRAYLLRAPPLTFVGFSFLGISATDIHAEEWRTFCALLSKCGGVLSSRGRYDAGKVMKSLRERQLLSTSSVQVYDWRRWHPFSRWSVGRAISLVDFAVRVGVLEYYHPRGLRARGTYQHGDVSRPQMLLLRSIPDDGLRLEEVKRTVKRVTGETLQPLPGEKLTCLLKRIPELRVVDNRKVYCTRT